MEALEEIDKSGQQSQLKLLISKGKEQGFLTYHEVNDHLPNDIVDPEQIEDIINMINDMGIKVHETPPDLDAMLLNDNDVDEEAAEEAAAALAAVDNEFGRTTDPVRMYMREMGTVDLLTREGEIKIAKRIEDGLNQVLSALTDFPTVSERFLAEYARAQAGEIKITDILSGFIDYSAETVIPQPRQPSDSTDSSDDDDDDDAAALTPDPEEVAERFAQYAKIFKKVQNSTKRNGRDHKRTETLRTELQEKFLEFKLVPKITDKLTVHVRGIVDEIRRQEKTILEICVKQCRMPRKDFLGVFIDAESNPKWLRSVVRQKKPYASAIKEWQSDIQAAQKRLLDSSRPGRQRCPRPAPVTSAPTACRNGAPSPEDSRGSGPPSCRETFDRCGRVSAPQSPVPAWQRSQPRCQPHGIGGSGAEQRDPFPFLRPTRARDRQGRCV